MTKLDKQSIQLGIGIISLAALLSYTLVHTGGLLARYVHPSFVGYIVALGVELSIVSFSLRIGDLKRTRQSAKFVYFVLVSTVVISALANISEGYRTLYNEPLTVSNIGKLDIVQAIVGLSATGLISLIVFALSEIIGVDVETTAKTAQRTERQTKTAAIPSEAVPNTAESDSDSVSAEQARLIKQAADDERIAVRRSKLLSYLDTNPDAGPTELSRALDVSRSTVYSDLQALNGQAAR